MFKFEIREIKTDEGIKFQGYVLKNEDIILHTDGSFKSQSRAIIRIKSMWNTAIFCSHVWGFSQEYVEHGEHGETDDVIEYRCNRCALIKRAIKDSEGV